MQALIFPNAVWRRVWRDAAIVVAVVICLARATGLAWPFAHDFHAYYSADLGQLYVGAEPGGAGSYLYSPLFAQIIEPLRWLPYSIALALWTALELGSLIYVAGPWSLLLFLPLAPEWMDGNVHLVMAAAVYAALRQPTPWAWAVPAFTKLAPAIGLAWFAFRREWSALARALVVVVGLAGVSFLLVPAPWIGWVQMLLASVGAQSALPGTIGIPLLLRLPLALALLAWGARTNRRWTVAIACGLSMPSFWISAAFAFGIVALRVAELPSWANVQMRRPTHGMQLDRGPSLATVPVVATTKS